MRRLLMFLSIAATAWGQARELNNQGAQQFARGEYRGAGDLFARALEAWKKETPPQEREMALTIGNLRPSIARRAASPRRSG